MLGTYRQPVFPYRRSADQTAPRAVHHPVIVVGAGPVGLAAALDCAIHGIATVVLDEDDTVSVGSRAVCYAKRALEVLDRLGCGEPIAARGVSWNLGKVYFHDRLVYSFDLLPEEGHRRPAFVNLQQYHFEEAMLERVLREPSIDLRWKNRVIGIEQGASGVAVRIETPDGEYTLTCDWLIACDGARSPVRHMLGLESKGQVFKDHFLIADLVLKDADFPVERRFWFDPPFHRNQSCLMHKQADDVWRIDFQLGWDTDVEAEKRPERVIPRIKAMLGDDVQFDLAWVSVYTFQCRRMDRFRHGRVLFAGDAAHQVSPFGARGANSGIQDTDNLAWKLALVMAGKAPEALVDSYCDEREAAADENILNSTRSTDFITPKSATSRVFRDAVLELARDLPFARTLVNSGRLSVPAVLSGSRLNTPDTDFAGVGGIAPGRVAADAPVMHHGRRHWLLEYLGNRFNGVLFVQGGELDASTAEALASLAHDPIPVRTLVVAPHGRPLKVVPLGCDCIEDVDGLLEHRYDLQPGTFHLLRPDQHVVARWRSFDQAAVRRAVRRATCND
jgi:3-(3-hydroxy-phenyl)propionate hydroxylase